MGHVHHAPGPIPADHVAQHLPALPDRDIARLVTLATAYSNVRGVLVALAGLSVLQATGRQAEGDVEAVVAGLAERLHLVGAHIAAVAPSRHPVVHTRVRHVDRAVGLLREELDELRTRPARRVSLERLALVHTLLRDSTLVSAGMRELSSTSCASWHSHQDTTTP